MQWCSAIRAAISCHVFRRRLCRANTVARVLSVSKQASTSYGQGAQCQTPEQFWHCCLLGTVGSSRSATPQVAFLNQAHCHCGASSARDWRARACIPWRGGRCLRLIRIGCTGSSDGHGPRPKDCSEGGGAGRDLRPGIRTWSGDQPTTIVQLRCRSHIGLFTGSVVAPPRPGFTRQGSHARLSTGKAKKTGRQPEDALHIKRKAMFAATPGSSLYNIFPAAPAEQFRRSASCGRR